MEETTVTFNNKNKTSWHQNKNTIFFWIEEQIEKLWNLEEAKVHETKLQNSKKDLITFKKCYKNEQMILKETTIAQGVHLNLV